MAIPSAIADKVHAIQPRQGGGTGAGQAQLFFWLAALMAVMYAGLPFLAAHMVVADTFFLEALHYSGAGRMALYALGVGVVWWPLALWAWLRFRVTCAPLGRRNLHQVLDDYGLLARGADGTAWAGLTRLVFGQGALKAVIDIQWVNCPPAGQASAANPVVLAIQKSPRLRRSVFEEATFWGAIRGVRAHLATVDGADLPESGNDDFYFLLLSDRLRNLPDRLAPADLPDPATLPAGRFPVGMTAFNDIHHIDFTKRPNALICGGSGSGKTMATQWVLHCLARQGIDVAAIDPDHQFGQLGLDPAFSFVRHATSLAGFKEILEGERTEMEARNRGEAERRARVLVIDELPKVLEEGGNLLLLRDLVQRMRKQRMACIAIMQNPAAEILPPALRDNFMWRLCGKLDNPDEVANLFPGSANAADRLAQITGPGIFLTATATDLELIRTPFDPRLEPADEGW